jgi:formylglycine-generating enzyme
MKRFRPALLALAIAFTLTACDKKKEQAVQTIGGAPIAKELTLDLGNGASIKLVLIQAGSFRMGSSEKEKGRDIDESPHDVTLSKPFFLGATHVTVDQFAAFIKDSGYKTEAEKETASDGIEIKDGNIELKKITGCSWRTPGFEQKGDHPVVEVSWNDARAFCDWLSKKTGKKVTLPTEAQWEYACRAGAATTYPWGDNPDDGKGWANVADQSLKKTLPSAPAGWTFFGWDDGFAFTSPVASFKANALGLYDMTGNAWQWCQDSYGYYYEMGSAADKDPKGAPAGNVHVMRGGSWYNDPANCRAARRNWHEASGRQVDYGFRIAVSD